jgi:hypothetical protein
VGYGESLVTRVPKALSFDPAMAIQELLRGAEPSVAQLAPTFLQMEATAKLFVSRVFVVA